MSTEAEVRPFRFDYLHEDVTEPVRTGISSFRRALP
jgi:hypothetical protein